MSVFTSKRPAPAPRTPAPGQLSSTSPQEDVQALADALMGVIQTAPFDDMLWAEIDAALRQTSHQLKLVYQTRGTLDPPDVPLAASRRQ